MPFDGATPKRSSEQQANLLELIHDLRNLPEDWEWDYGNCTQCALGRIAKLQGISPQGGPMYDAGLTCFGLHGANEFLGLSNSQSEAAFLAAGDSTTKPQRVADILEGYL